MGTLTAEERDALRLEVDQRRRQRLRTGPRKHDAPARPEPNGRRPASTLDPHRQAGRANVEKMREAFGRLGRATMRDAARLAGVGTGTSTWAVRALLAEGAIRPTGREVRRSPEFEATAP